MSIMKQPVIKPVHNPVFLTSDSLEDVILQAQLELPELTPNRLRVLFGQYHNTLLKQLTSNHPV